MQFKETFNQQILFEGAVVGIFLITDFGVTQIHRTEHYQEYLRKDFL